MYFGSTAAASDRTCDTAIRNALLALHIVIPVVPTLLDYRAWVPQSLNAINGWQWNGHDSAVHLSRLLLQELGIEERQRRVFISYKREDGLLAAEQIYEHLSKHAFQPFMDRFDIQPAVDVQAAIADALESFAFLLLVETPLAHTSGYVFDEVEYALAHTMGIHVLSWPGNPIPVPGSVGLPRQRLNVTGLAIDKGYEILTEGALEETLEHIEAAHAYALVRRRRNIVRSIEESAESKGMACLSLPKWRLLIEGPGRYDLVGVCAKLPEVEDLWLLDEARRSYTTLPSAVLVHAARTLGSDRRSVLQWAAGDRPLTLVPENAIGGYW